MRTYFLKISLRVIFLFGLDDISKVINQVQLPRIFLINFLQTQKKNKNKNKNRIVFN